MPTSHQGVSSLLGDSDFCILDKSIWTLFCFSKRIQNHQSSNQSISQSINQSINQNNCILHCTSTNASLSLMLYYFFPVHSGAPAPRRAAKRSPILIWERKGNPWVDFLMVIMASGIARGRVRTTTSTKTTTVESRKMAAILQIIGWQRHAALVYCVFLWYWTSML